MTTATYARRLRAVDAALVVPIIAAALPSLILLVLLPPLYTDTTIVTIVQDPGHAMPHYPPLYGVFVWLLHLVARMFGAQAGTSDAGVWLMALAQQAVLVWAIVYFAMACSSTLVGRLFAIAPFYVLLQFTIINLGLQTEALWLSSLIFLFGAGIRIVRAGALTRRSATALFLSFTACLLLRPTGLFFAPIVPAGLLLVALFERDRQPAFAAMLAVLVLGGSYLTSNVIFRTAMAIDSKAFVTPWGRGTTEVLQRLVWRMEDGNGLPKADRATLIPPLQANAGSARLREAIPTLVTYLDRTHDGTAKVGVWGGSHTAMFRRGLAHTMTEADRLVNEFCALFIRTFPALMFSEFRSTLSIYGQALVRSGPYDYSNLLGAIAARDAALFVFRDQPSELTPAMRSIAMSTRNAEHLAASERFKANPYVAWVARAVSPAHLALLLLTLLAIGLLARRLDGRSIAFVLAGVMVLTLYVALASLLLVFIWRYLLPIELFLGVAIGLVAARIASGRRTDAAGIRSSHSPKPLLLLRQ